MRSNNVIQYKKLSINQKKVLSLIKDYNNIFFRYDKEKEKTFNELKNLLPNIDKNLDFCTNSGNTPLILFLKNKKMPSNRYEDNHKSASLDFEMFKLLFECTKNTNHQNKQGKTAFNMVCNNRDKELILFFLSITGNKEIDFSIKDNKCVSQFMSVMSSINKIINFNRTKENKEFFDKVFELIDKKKHTIEIDNQNKNHQTALTIALNSSSEMPSTSIISKVLSYNPNLNIKDKEGRNALLIAGNKNRKTLKMLLDKIEEDNISVDINNVDNIGNNILFYVDDVNNFEKLMRLGASPFLENKNGETALSYLSNKSKKDKDLKILVEKLLIDEKIPFLSSQTKSKRKFL